MVVSDRIREKEGGGEEEASTVETRCNGIHREGTNETFSKIVPIHRKQSISFGAHYLS